MGASSTCCHSEDSGVKLVSAQALKGCEVIMEEEEEEKNRGGETAAFGWRDTERKERSAPAERMCQ